MPEPIAPELPVPELPHTRIIERTRHRYDDVHGLLGKGWAISAIARRLNLDRKPVRRFRDTDLDQPLASAGDRGPHPAVEFRCRRRAREPGESA
ncbi:hypothetical protein JIX56_43630 [Streptomyces sp. CA-210063]|uniref:hypothetical protein n=1 Tax=Streptomyces sp. CA-210063 TaxID=2801029 RepID=UPI00214A8D91|nr:hypothetical protein [Streptomyces sp. CA-210063]UUU36175.1 hypothetical protein JIX56_43630 [Streptomyces sp. CA-210063]